MCGGTQPVIGNGQGTSHLPYPPYLPPPGAPHPSTISIQNALVIDGSEGCHRFRANVWIRNGLVDAIERIAEEDLTRVSPATIIDNGTHQDGYPAVSFQNTTGKAPRDDPSILAIDASSLILCPGFIDMHAHSDLHLLSHPSHVPKLSQGITLEVVGQDGIGYAPLVDPEYDEVVSTREEKKGISGDRALEYVRKQIAGWNGNPDVAPTHWDDYRREISISSAPISTATFDGWINNGGDAIRQPFFTWCTTAEYLNTLDAHHLPVNVAVLAPQGNLRLLVLGPDPPHKSSSGLAISASASNDEIKQMRKILRKALDEGAVGMSSGLTYVPGMYADYDELKALCEELVVARSQPTPGMPTYTPYYAPHHRSYGLNALGAYDEMMRLGEDTGAPIHLTHATLNFPTNSGKADKLLSMIAQYESRGVDVSLDTYPYTAGSTTLAAMLPSWAAGGGVDAVMKRLRGEGEEMKVWRDGREVTLRREGLLEAIREDVCLKGSDGCHGLTVDWDTIEIAGLGTEVARSDVQLASMVGKTVGEIARSFTEPSSSGDQTHIPHWGLLSDPFDLFLHILLSDSLSTSIIQHVGHEDNVRKVMRHSSHMFGTDALLAPSKPHPRAWGSTGRYLGWYARDILRDQDEDGKEWIGPDRRPEPPPSDNSPAPFRREYSLEDVIPHLTSRSARRLGLLWEPDATPSDNKQKTAPKAESGDVANYRTRVPRGLVAPGYAADLVIFDPNIVRDQATFGEPNKRCTGIEWVLVNGVVAVEKGRVTGARGGKTVRRDKDTGLVW